MRAAFILSITACLLLVAGCRAEPDFDTKFEQQSRALSTRAARIEAESSQQLRAAREAERAAAELSEAPATSADRASKRP